jgi:hypothetical protein
LYNVGNDKIEPFAVPATAMYARAAFGDASVPEINRRAPLFRELMSL